ncbi:hypothetical protein [Terasakiella pusilla]|uniref:hypothetical protein n=1 Tax=Terasakiella pusilla TaxID=64973 RepID=UPI003AA86E97
MALAAEGKDVWNKQIVRWYAVQQKEDNFSDRIDFRDVTFGHDFKYFVFPCCVDFSGATLKSPSFLGASFNGSECRALKRKDGFGYFGHWSAWFSHTVFEKDVCLLHLRKMERFSFYFSHASFRGDKFDFEVRAVGLDTNQITLFFDDVKEFAPKGNAVIKCKAKNVELRLRGCNLHDVELMVEIETQKLKLYFLNNDLKGAAVYFQDVKATDDSSIALFKDNTVQKSWMAFRDLSLSGSIDFTNHDKMGLETFFYRCNVDRLSFKKCSVGSTFWQMIDCQIAKNVKFDEVTFKCDGELTFPDRMDGLTEEEIKALPSHRRIAHGIDHDYTERGFAFRGVKVEGTLSTIDNCNFIGPAIFEGSVFDCPVSLRNTTFKSDVPDWRLTKLNAHFSLDGIKVIAPTTYDEANGPEDFSDLSDRYRRLKELAITAKDHDRELEFFAEEMRAKRLGEEKWYLRFPNLLYGAVSAYGRSIARPIAALVAIWFTVGYIVMMKWRILKGQYVDWDVAWQSFKLSGSLLTPFLGLSRTVYNDMMKKLFDKEPLGFFVDTVFLLEGALGVILIFLIGLALRNRFRL